MLPGEQRCHDLSRLIAVPRLAQEINCGDQVLKISAKRFEGPGSGCDITGFSDNGDGTYTASMSCTAGGQTSNERISMRPIFAPTGEGIDLIYLDRNNLKSEVLRCDAQ